MRICWEEKGKNWNWLCTFERNHLSNYCCYLASKGKRHSGVVVKLGELIKSLFCNAFCCSDCVRYYLIPLCLWFLWKIKNAFWALQKALSATKDLKWCKNKIPLRQKCRGGPSFPWDCISIPRTQEIQMYLHRNSPQQWRLGCKRAYELLEK